MAADIHFIKGPLKFDLRFAEVDATSQGVEVSIQIEYSGRRQIVRWSADQLWCDYDALVRFESQLRDGGDARLLDMSDYPVLHFEPRLSREYLTINPRSERQSHDGDNMEICLKIDEGSMHALYLAFSQFGKWW